MMLPVTHTIYKEPGDFYYSIMRDFGAPAASIIIYFGVITAQIAFRDLSCDVDSLCRRCILGFRLMRELYFSLRFVVDGIDFQSHTIRHDSLRCASNCKEAERNESVLDFYNSRYTVQVKKDDILFN